MKLNTYIFAFLLFLMLSSLFTEVLISSRSFKKLKKLRTNRSSKYGTEARLDFFTQERNKFQGKYVYDFGEAGVFEAINKGNPTPISDRDQHKELGRGGFGRVALAKGKDGKEYIIKLMDVNEQDVATGGGDKTVAKSSILIKEQKQNGQTEYVMKYYAAKTYNCLKRGFKCAALLLEKIDGEELWSFLEKK